MGFLWNPSYMSDRERDFSGAPANVHVLHVDAYRVGFIGNNTFEDKLH